MSLDITRQATALIDHNQTRFHEGPRRALPELQAKAAVVEVRGNNNGLGDEPRAIGNALEQHMLEEESCFNGQPSVLSSLSLTSVSLKGKPPDDG
jgi:regulator of cell morphogenesis and NO signaling